MGCSACQQKAKQRAMNASLNNNENKPYGRLAIICPNKMKALEDLANLAEIKMQNNTEEKIAVLTNIARELRKYAQTNTVCPKEEYIKRVEDELNKF